MRTKKINQSIERRYHDLIPICFVYLLEFIISITDIEVVINCRRVEEEYKLVMLSSRGRDHQNASSSSRLLLCTRKAGWMSFLWSQFFCLGDDG